MYRRLVNTYGILEDQLTVLPTGVDTTLFERADGLSIRQHRGWGDDVVMISVGRLAPEKNFKMLLDAGIRSMQTNERLRLAFVGDGSRRDELEKIAQKAGFGERVDFIGRVPFTEIPSYLKAADLFGFASTTETQGLVTMEAMTVGLPVVAVDAIGTRDVVENGKEGLLVGDASESLAAAICQLLDNEEMMQHFMEASLQKSKEFDIRLQVKKLEDVYKQAIEDKMANQYVVVPKM